MRIIADLHIHSPYARAVSKEMTLENLDHWARLKGITVMGTGDFTHPKWMKEIKEKLEPAEPGLYVLKQEAPHQSRFQRDGTGQAGSRKQATRFMLTVEISSIYSKGGKVRRIHNLIFAPSIETAEKINAQLGWLGNITSDGRPILGLDSKELAKIVFNIDPDAVIVPAHAWTPWFSIFGSMSGFDSIEECFEEFAPQIFAIETGLSSDPAMNWRLSKLDNIAFISNSDSHSLQRIGREANV
ncbi:MAG: endonuclease Q family protein, partial [Patescibacteria group bacterium]